jgi:hypothetical protein
MQSIFTKLKSPIGICLVLILFTVLISDYNFRWKNEKWKSSINSDGYDYYRYLPMVFIDPPIDPLNHQATDKPLIKHYVGTAILFLPFFLLAYVFSALFHLPLDGYSVLFQIFIALGNLFYLLWGLLFFNKFLRFYIKSDWIIGLVLISSVFATNAFYYSVIAPAWCHVLSFAMISFLLYHVKKIYADYNKRSLFYIIIILSLIFWTRPTDIVVIVLLPFFAGDFITFRSTVQKIVADKKVLISAFLVALLPSICQLWTYKLQTGHFVIWAYTNEGFDFYNPEITNVLFSYAKGFFVYAPICFLSLFGLISLYKRNRFQFLGVLIYLILNVYIISSWWCWNYGFCYGQRAFIDHFTIFFFLLALVLNDLKSKWIRISVVVLIVLCNVLNWVQMYQYEKGILDNDYKTDKKGYWSVFLKTDSGYSGKYYRHPVDSSLTNIVKKIRYFNDMEKTDTTWINNNTLTQERAHSGKSSSLVNLNAWYSIGIKKKMTEIPYTKNTMIRVSGWFYISEKGSNAFFAMSFNNNGNALVYRPTGLDGFTEKFGSWEFHCFELYMPKLSKDIKIENDKENEVVFYLFNNSSINCYVDDLTIDFVEYKKLDRVLDIWWN